MPDYNYRTYAHAGLAVPSECPFFPVLRTNQSGDPIVWFNQAYVFDYQTKGDGGTVKKIKVSNMDQYFAANVRKSFFVKINTASESSRVISASFEEFSDGDSPIIPDKFHYSSKNLDASNVYSGGVGEFWVEVCTLDEKGLIDEVFARDNIHWQKTNYANTDREEDENTDIKETFGILYNWGDENAFVDSPTVKFSRLAQKTDSYEATIDPEHVIKLERSPNDENVVITTQIPKHTKGKLSVLERQITDEWNWVRADDSQNRDYLFICGYSNGGNAMWLDMPDGGCVIYGTKSENPVVQLLPFPTDANSGDLKILACDGADLLWIDNCCESTF